MNKFKEKRNNIINAMEALTNTARAETRALTEDEDKEYEKLKAELTALDKTIAKDEEMRALALKGTQTKGTESDAAETETRAFESYLRSGKVIESRAGSNITYGDNGAVIPNTIINKIIDKVVEICPIYQMATKYNIKGNISIPYVDTTNGDITVEFADEFTDPNYSSIKFSSIELKGYLARCTVLISKQMINNSQFDIVNFVINYIATKLAKFIEKFLLEGNTAKNPKSGLKNSVTQTVSIATAGKITADDMIEAQESIIDSLQSGCVWIMNKATRTKLRKLKDGDGQYLLNKDLTSTWGYTLLGKPVYTCEFVSSDLSKKGEIVAYYGDMSALAVKMSEGAEIQVLREKYAEQHAVGINTWFEIDNTVENAQKIVKVTVPTGV